MRGLTASLAWGVRGAGAKAFVRGRQLAWHSRLNDMLTAVTFGACSLKCATMLSLQNDRTILRKAEAKRIRCYGQTAVIK